MTEDELARLFWGKAGKARVPVVHPALFHMLDVGMVARVLVESAPASALRGLPGGEPLTPAEVGFLIAAHDLGKISPGFQQLRVELCTELVSQGYRIPSREFCEQDHSRVTLEHLKRRGAKRGAAKRLAQAISVHHGVFHGKGQVAEERLGVGLWDEARDAALRVLAEIFGVDGPAVLAPGRLTPAAAMVLAGLTAVADWIGSDERHFPRAGTQPPTVKVYADEAAGQARDAVAALRWDVWRPDGLRPPFTELFPGRTPNPMQELAEQVALELSAPGLILIEAPMGVGKTEAALLIADRCLNRFGHVGIFYGLPTQATSNQMFGRFLDYLRFRLPGSVGNVHLLHGLATYVDQYDGLPSEFPEPEPTGIGEEGSAGGQAHLVAASWFRGQKRELLAPFGVGTVDQALLGVIQTRHMFVRLYALAHKVVILDEVHAYDTYTTTLLEELLRWLGAVDCTVILLSATLPPAKRHDLLRAFAGETAQVEDAPYPRITAVERGRRARVLSFPAMEGRTLRLARWSDGRKGLADELTERLRTGGCAAWLCNTVKSAQLTYLRLNAHPELHGRVRLIHAQFPVAERRRLETELEARFGRDGNRPGEIWVATQVIEQSLDVDFDLMISELAPIDLLLQRSGRLQRHSRVRPRGLEAPELYWLEPEVSTEGIPEFGASGCVYAPHLLLRSWWALQGRKTLCIPDEIDELIRLVYEAGPLALPPALREAAETLREEWETKKIPATRKALGVALPTPDEDDPFCQRYSLIDDEDDPTVAPRLRALTRDGEPTVTLVCAHRVGDRFALAPDGGDPRDPERLPNDPQARREHEKAVLLRSVRLQGAEWVSYFAARNPPRGWEKVAALRHLRLLPLTSDEFAEPGAPGRLLLHLQLGMVRHEEVRQALRDATARSGSH